jgi:hypothetical protein
MTRELDPEIAADLARITRTDRPRLDDAEFSARVAQTGRDAQETIRETIRTAKLADRGETSCDRCKHVVKPYYKHCPRCEGWTNHLQVERLADAIRKVKQQPPTPAQEQAFIKRLIELGHPDATGFIAAVTEQTKQGGKRARGAL